MYPISHCVVRRQDIVNVSLRPPTNILQPHSARINTTVTRVQTPTTFDVHKKQLRRHYSMLVACPRFNGKLSHSMYSKLE
jgi:hypothetical protein